MKGARILVASPPRGVFEDVIVVGTPKPGTLMEIQPSVAHVGGLFSYRPYGTQAASSGLYVAADGNKKAIAILLEKDDVNGIYSRSYVTGERGKIYWPAMGEQFNMILENQSGTADAYAIGQEYMADDGTGKLLAADADAEAHPFTGLEAVTAMTADVWCWVRFNGAGGA